MNLKWPESSFNNDHISITGPNIIKSALLAASSSQTKILQAPLLITDFEKHHSTKTYLEVLLCFFSTTI